MTTKNNRIKIYIYLEIIYATVFGLFVNIGISIYIRLVTDVLLACCLVIVLYGAKKQRVELLSGKSFLFISLIWSVCSIISGICNHISPFHMLLASRNWFRGPIFVFVCIVGLTGVMYQQLFTSLYYIFIGNFFVSLFQLVCFGRKGDDLTGILLDNGSTNVLLCVLLIWILSEAFSKYERLNRYIIYSFFALWLASLEEIKVFYFEYLVIVVFFFIFACVNKKNFQRQIKTFLIVSVCAMASSLLILYIFHPNSLETITSISGYLKYEETSRSSYLISRIHAFSEIKSFFFEDGKTSVILFGLGFGKTFSIGTSLFYTCYQKLILEEGIFGVIGYLSCYVAMFCNAFFYSFRFKKITLKLTYVMAICACVVILFIYDSALYKECVYLFSLAIAYGLREEETLNEQGKAVVSESVK